MSDVEHVSAERDHGRCRQQGMGQSYRPLDARSAAGVLLHLQRTVGNAAVNRLVATHAFGTAHASPAGHRPFVVQRALQLLIGTPPAPVTLSAAAAYDKLREADGTRQAGYHALCVSDNKDAEVTSILREIDARNPAPMTLDALHAAVHARLAEVRMAFTRIADGKGVDWLTSTPDNKATFMRMLGEVAGKSTIMRDLVIEISREADDLRSIEIQLASQHEGRHLIDSFVKNTINLGDLAFFPETPAQDTPWEQTRGEHLVHVLHERRRFYGDPRNETGMFQFRGASEAAKAQQFGRHHASAIEMHNRYRVEQGQRPELPHQAGDAVGTGAGKTSTTHYEGGYSQTLTLSGDERPLGKAFAGPQPALPSQPVALQ